MKKRYYFLVMIFVSCVWICGTKISVYAEEQTQNEPTDMLIAFDTLLSEFMNEDNEDGVSRPFIPKACEIELAYDNGLVSLPCDSMTYMAEGYGVEAKVYYFEEAQFTSSSVYAPGNSYLYLDVVFRDKARIGNDDMLWITLPAGFGLSHVKGRWAQPDAEAGWIAVKDFTISSDVEMTNHISVPLNQIEHGENGNRLLLSFHVTPTGEAVTGVQRIKVTWRNNPMNIEVNPNAVIAPGFENTDSLWKVVLLAVVLILDVIVAVIVYRNLKHHSEKKDKSNTQTVELSEEETAVVKEKLQNSLNIDNEEIEYLKSIGYFEPKSNFKK